MPNINIRRPIAYFIYPTILLLFRQEDIALLNVYRRLSTVYVVGYETHDQAHGYTRHSQDKHQILHTRIRGDRS
jgi:hypothetical protein